MKPTFSNLLKSKILSCLLCLAFYCVQAKSATIVARSPSLADVRLAVANAVNGDTVTIPAGIAYWTNTLHINGKAITVEGAGPTNTIIVDEIPNRSQSVLVVGFGNRLGMFRLTGLQFKGGTTNTGQHRHDGVVRIFGSNVESNNSVWRIDHCFFNRNQNRTLGIHAWNGLIDNCRFDQGGYSGISVDARISGVERGDRAWSHPVRWGTVDAGVYIENCWFTNSTVRAAIDAYAGARYVFRNNVVHNGAVENHGTETTQRTRGGRAMEVYGNVFTCTAMSEFAVLIRSGTALIYSNVISGSFPGLLRMQNYRDSSPYPPWNQANGKNIWDNNYTNLYTSGLHSGTNGSKILSDANKSWTAHQWVGHHLINLQTGRAGIIVANTATSITCASAIESWAQLFWSTGDFFEVRKVRKALDQPGAGRGDMIYGTSDTTPPTPTRWPNQSDEPIMYWHNSGINNVSASGFYTIIAGRDYTNAVAPHYQPLVYPHPFAGSGVKVNPPHNVKALSR